MAPYSQRPVPKRAFWQRWFSIYPKSTGYILVENLLASKPIVDITHEELQPILHQYKLQLTKHDKAQAATWYGQYLSWCLRDRQLSKDEVDALAHLQALLLLDHTTVKQQYSSVVEQVYRHAVEEVMADNEVSETERVFLADLKERLAVPSELAETIYRKTADDRLQALLQDQIADEQLSPQEEQALYALADRLHIELQLSNATRQLLEKYKLYWQIAEGDVPTIDPGINLFKNESCYFTAAATWLEYRTVSQRYNYSGPTARIKIAKGIYWRMGSMNVKPTPKEELRPIDTGYLYLTSKRIIFMGQRRNKTIRLNRILDFTIFSNGVDIQKDAGASPFIQFSDNNDLFAMLLGRALQDY